MAIYRVSKDKNNPFVVINKKFILDPQLSAKAKGILAYLLSRPDDWQVYEKEIINNFKDGRDSIRSGIKELVETGYIERKMRRSETGTFIGYEYDVYETPIHIGKSEVDKPTSENPTSDNPILENPTLLNKELNQIKNKLNNKNTKLSEIRQKVLDHWNTKEALTTHSMNKAITKAMKAVKDEQTAKDICIAINRYYNALNDKDFYYKNTWTLDKFISQSNGYVDWLDEGQRYIHYKNVDLTEGKSNSNKQSCVRGQKKAEITEDDF